MRTFSRFRKIITLVHYMNTHQTFHLTLKKALNSSTHPPHFFPKPNFCPPKQHSSFIHIIWSLFPLNNLISLHTLLINFFCRYSLWSYFTAFFWLLFYLTKSQNGFFFYFCFKLAKNVNYEDKILPFSFASHLLTFNNN